MKDTSPEIEQLQFEMMMNFDSNKRIEMACEMFMAARELILNSLPKDIPETERRRRYFQKMYGHPLPEDFFN
jgi:hypothetical protein